MIDGSHLVTLFQPRLAPGERARTVFEEVPFYHGRPQGSRPTTLRGQKRNDGPASQRNGLPLTDRRRIAGAATPAPHAGPDRRSSAASAVHGLAERQPHRADAEQRRRASE